MKEKRRTIVVKDYHRHVEVRGLDNRLKCTRIDSLSDPYRFGPVVGKKDFESLE